MQSMTATRSTVTVGVDTHAEVHVAAVVCNDTQRLLGVESFATTSKGLDRLWDWMIGYGAVDAVGVEGTGTYGAGLARHLTAQGVRVIEVDRPDRAARRARGKSDPVDAEAAARAVNRPRFRAGLIRGAALG